MMATSKRMPQEEPGEIEMLLPWHAAGTLNARDARRVEEAMARDPELARQFAAIRDEYAETIHLNETLGAPSARAMQNLFAAIDGEPAQSPPAMRRGFAAISAFFAGLSPRTLAWSAAAGALLVLIQAGVIGTVLLKGQGSTFQTASLSMNEPITRDLGAGAPPRALVRFAPEARIADITALLDTYQASIVDGASGGMFRLQFGNRPMTQDQVTALLAKLQNEKIISLAVPAQ